MGVITYSNSKESWVVARWAFRQFLQDLSRQHQDDIEITRKIEQAAALDGIHLELIDAVLASKILEGIRRTATGIHSGSICSTVVENYPDPESQQMYHEGISELVKLLESWSKLDNRSRQ